MLSFYRKFIFFISLFTVFFAVASFADSDVPSWYNGDAKLFKEFISACKLANEKCSENKYNCNVQSLEAFNKVYISIQSCIIKLHPNVKPTERRVITPEKSRSDVASVRG